MASTTGNVDQLKRAIQLAEQIETLQTELNQLFEVLGDGGSEASPAAASAGTPRKRRKMSKAARERIAAAQRARWAKQKGEIS
jgi:hypothetical protein